MKKRKGHKEAGGVQLVATESADEMNCVPPDFSQINQFETVWSDFPSHHNDNGGSPWLKGKTELL
mgnify:CR=1 FL=1